MADAILSVKQLNTYIRSLFDGDAHLNGVYVCGEISNFKLHYQSGHIYFTLKDDQAVIKAVMFRQSASSLAFTPTDGMKVICFGRVSVYEASGQYQLYVTSIQPEGIGALAIAFEQLKAKLEKEGLFDASKKRPLPQLPSGIGVITSGTGAALQDILSILCRRAPHVPVYVYPVQVQGQAAAPDMVKALKVLYKHNNVDVIIIGRGGGSIEDLWAFNDEALARTVAASPVPVISAVGHQTDFTICDFVADLRAPTPSAAAELAVSDNAQTVEYIKNVRTRLSVAVKNKIALYEKEFADVCSCKYFTEPSLLFADWQDKYLDVKKSLKRAYEQYIAASTALLAQTVAKLDALSPLAVISRGYTVVKKENNIIDSVAKISPDDLLCLSFSDGKADCKVINTERNEQDEL